LRSSASGSAKRGWGMTSPPDLPEELLSELRPPFPRLRILLRVFAEDPRATLTIDNVIISAYLLSPPRLKRSTVTQQLHQAVKQGLLSRAGRGRYALTPVGRARFEELHA
jgi:hypothetical protein